MVRYRKTTSAGCMFTSNMSLCTIVAWFWSPCSYMAPMAFLAKSSRSSIPTAFAPNSFAAIMSVRPSPAPRSYNVSPGFSLARVSMWCITGSGVATKGAMYILGGSPFCWFFGFCGLVFGFVFKFF